MSHRLLLRSPRRCDELGRWRGNMELQKNVSEQLVIDGIGEQIFALAAKLYPICRSITGNGVRDTLHEIGTHIDLDVREVPTGTPVFDWTIPREWNIRDAYIKDAARRKDRRLCPIQPPCDELQRSRAEAGLTYRTQKTHLHAAGSTRPDPLSHLVLCGELGLLHVSPPV